jgi:hypothetical protein
MLASASFNICMLLETCKSNVQSHVVLRVVLQIRDYRKDWNLEVNEPIAGNYYPVCFLCHLSFSKLMLGWRVRERI